MPLLWQSPPQQNSHSLPAPSERILNLPFHLREFTDWPHIGTEDACSILPGWPSSGTAATTPLSVSQRLTFPRIIRQEQPPIKTETAIMTTTREEMAEDNRREGGGLLGWRIRGGHRSLLDAVTQTCVLGFLGWETSRMRLAIAIKTKRGRRRLVQR